MTDKEKEVNLYKMKLHESTTQGALEIIRVPGGWIYSWVFGGAAIEGVSMVFVKMPRAGER